MALTDLFDAHFNDILDYNQWIDLLYEESFGLVGLLMMLAFNIIHLTYYIVKNRENLQLNYNLFETMLYSSFLTMVFGLALWYIQLLRELTHYAFFVLELCISIAMMIYYKYRKI